MKEIIKLGILSLIPILAFAQDFDSEVNSELDGLYNQQTQTKIVKPVPTTTQTQPTQIIIQQTQPSVQKQPTTIIEASPLKESRAEQIRRSRQEAELMTEQKIVEKLEQSRMEDEKRRAEVLFGDKFNQLTSKQEAQPVAPAPVVVAPAPVPVVVPEQAVAPVPAPVADDQDKELDREMIRNEVSAALADMKPEEKKVDKKTYFTLMGGMPEYSGFQNVQSNYSVGFAFGQKIDDRFLVEGSFQYSNLEVQQRDGLTNCYYDVYSGYVCEYYPRITNMDQYNTSMVGKYHILQGAFRPLVGGLMSYTYRAYTDKQLAIENNDANSSAIDAGLLIGAEMEISDNVALGLDYRYMWNMWYKTSARKDYSRRSFSQVYYGSDQLIEKSSYSILSLTARASF